MPSKSWFNKIHQRLLRRDPTASAECAEAVIGPTTSQLQIRFPKLRGTDVLADAVTDAVMSYLKRPEQYDPSKRGLLGFLVMAAEGDLRNALAKHRRRRNIEMPMEDVDLQIPDGNDQVTTLASGLDTDEEAIRRALHALFPDPRDLKMAGLVLDGERSVSAFAQVLAVERLPLGEQRREVKRHKDRIKKKLERYGQSIRSKGT